MFSSLASFIFGSNTSATTNSEPTTRQEQQQQQPQEQQQQQLQPQQQQQQQPENENRVRLDAENIIHVTSLTPSVTGSQNESTISTCETGAGRSLPAGKRCKANKRNNKNHNSRNTRSESGQKKVATSLVKLLTPTESCDEELNEDEWFIVVHEDEESSLPRTDSEEDLSVVEVKGIAVPAVLPLEQPIANNNAAAHHSGEWLQRQLQQPQQRQHINSHSLRRVAAPPRPRARNNNVRHLILNPPRNIAIDAGTNTPPPPVDVAECFTQSLCVARQQPAQAAASSHALAASACSPNCIIDAAVPTVNMEESWFVTPPPCFTSIGPINMETSPYENLLIEHPSMSVYHCIRSAQEATTTDSFVNLELSVGESRPTAVAAVSATAAVESHSDNTAADHGMDLQAMQEQYASRNAGTQRSDRYSTAKLKQELIARSVQKSQIKKDRQNLCRGAMARANKVRDFQSKSNRQRRSDMQHCKILSGANNNRKCCF